MSATFGEWAEWTAKGIRWSVGGVPALYERKLPFTVRLERDESAWRRLGLRKMWRTMRDEFYDEKLNHLDWNAVLPAYDEIAGQIDDSAFSRLASMLFGELNASHLGFTPRREGAATAGWKRETGHPGILFDPSFAGPGLLVRSVIAGSSADRDVSRLVPGDVVTHINGAPVMPDDDLCPLLEGPLPRDVLLTLRRGNANLVVRLPLSTSDSIRELARKAETEAARAKVHEWSQGRAGYILLEAMRNDDLRLFEKMVYEEGDGRDGLVIDVRNNRGGFTADQILSILIYPQHAVTIPRGGQPGYQGSYLKRPRWNKPVTVLCNEHTASNGEIFSHAIKSTGRGKLVGKTTQGGVISTSDREVLDLGTFRIPHRGWFSQPDGIDMERQGAEPDIAVENPPGSRAAGFDPQLFAAVTVLLEDIKAAAHQEHLTYKSGLDLPVKPGSTSTPGVPAPGPVSSPE
ncbi:MAG: S41 family peptidase [Kiritimatiellia bacterium]